MSRVLHLVNKSPADRPAFETCLRMARRGDAILMIEDGVYAALAGTGFADCIGGHLDDFSFYALGPDIDARGLTGMPLIEAVGIIDYAGFVDLVAATDLTQSWL